MSVFSKERHGSVGCFCVHLLAAFISHVLSFSSMVTRHHQR